MRQETGNWDHCLEHASISDVGVRRSNNQDAVGTLLASNQEAFQRRGHLLMVADGMGAHAAGELASKLAVDIVTLTYPKLRDAMPPDALLESLRDANNRIHSRGQASPDFKGMGTTSTALLLLPQGALMAHVGDSRAYRLRGSRIEQLTFDHSLVWELQASGQLAENASTSHIPKNVITRSLGPNADVQIDLEGPHPIEVGDTFLLCSDGLTGQVEDEEIGLVLRAMPVAEAVQALVDLANLRGGPDNISIVAARVTGPQVARNTSSEAGTETPSQAQPVHPAVWTSLGVFVLAAIGAGMADLGWIAVGCAIIAMVVGLVALLIRYSGQPEPTIDGRRFGKGPYTASDCGSGEQLALKLKQILGELRDSAMREDWVVDWSRFNSLATEADRQLQAAEFDASLCAHFRAIRFMMDELRQPRDSSDSSSVLDL